MLEIVMIIGAVVFMARVADAENRSAMAWGGLTLLICLASMVIPLAGIRIVIAVVVSFVAMMVAKAVKP